MFYFFTKRAIDISLSLIFLVLSAPILIFIALAVKLDSFGPVFADMPERVGLNGKIFRMYKFRSMIKNAHILLKKDPRFKKLYQHYVKNSFKIPTNTDPRITKVGKFIRKTSLDELPQLINILKGDMSLVGPRAFHVDELEKQQKRFPKTKIFIKQAVSIKPGLTGPWQVSGRSAIDFPERIKLDAKYAENRSVFYDLLILLKTIPAVFGGEGN